MVELYSIANFDSSKHSTFENLNYILSLSHGDLTIPDVDLMHYVCKSFVMLHFFTIYVTAMLELEKTISVRLRYQKDSLQSLCKV